MQSMVTAKLEISPSIEKTSDGVKVRIKTVLTNSGATPVWVNKRMLFNTVYAPKPFREIWFDVKAPSGDKLEFRCKVKAGAAREEHYALLKPGESVERDIRLSDCFNMAEKGEYEIKAHYQDGNKEVPPAPSNTVHLKDEFESKTIKISIQ